MTNSELGKRERLVAGACRVLHEQGVEATTLADIAEAADVPVGNVYYYFKTKDELIEAAIDAHADHIQTVLAEFERHRTPRARLKALALSWTEVAEQVARYGCQHGTLCQELAKRDDGLDRRAAKLMALAVDWAEEQFRLMGKRDARRPRRRARRRRPGDRAADQQLPRPRDHDPAGSPAGALDRRAGRELRPPRPLSSAP